MVMGDSSMVASSVQAESDAPSTGGIIAAIVFWVVAIVLVLVSVPLTNIPTWVWVLRIALVVIGVALAIGLILRERYRKNQGLTEDRDTTPVDLWTIAHTTAGLVMGAWSVAGLLVAIFTIGWEIFEYTVPGFGDKETFANRVVDVAVAWIGWILVAGIVAAATGTAIAWLPFVKN
jgi:hypothetical protein